MKVIEVEPTRRTAQAGGGVLWGEFDKKTQTFRLATTGGVVTHTGIAGPTLGGGIGWLMLKHDATVDSLLSAEVVTAEGDIITASVTEHPDLFWGIRGGGGNCGIVTSFEYRLHPVGPRCAGGSDPPLAGGRTRPPTLCCDFIAVAPDELTTFFNLRRTPSLPQLPPELHGHPVAMVVVCYAGALAQGAAVLRPLRRFGSPLSTRSRPGRTSRSNRCSTQSFRTVGILLEVLGTPTAEQRRHRQACRARRGADLTPSPTASPSISAER